MYVEADVYQSRDYVWRLGALECVSAWRAWRRGLACAGAYDSDTDTTDVRGYAADGHGARRTSARRGRGEQTGAAPPMEPWPPPAPPRPAAGLDPRRALHMRRRTRCSCSPLAARWLANTRTAHSVRDAGV